jgi:hypothetical protein
MPPVTFQAIFLQHCQLVYISCRFLQFSDFFSANEKNQGGELKRLLKKNLKEVGFLTHVAMEPRSTVLIFYRWNSSVRSHRWRTVL